MVQILQLNTNHYITPAYLYIIGLGKSPQCKGRKAGHIFSECLLLAHQKNVLFQKLTGIGVYLPFNTLTQSNQLEFYHCSSHAKTVVFLYMELNQF